MKNNKNCAVCGEPDHSKGQTHPFSMSNPTTREKKLREVSKKDWAIGIARWLAENRYPMRPDAEAELLLLMSDAVESELTLREKEVKAKMLEDWAKHNTWFYTELVGVLLHSPHFWDVIVAKVRGADAVKGDIGSATLPPTSEDNLN